MYIIKVENKKQLKQFIDFPYHLYENNPYWIPQLKFSEKIKLSSKKNPFFKTCETAFWLCVDSNHTVVGRVAGIIHKQGEHDKKYARFGLLEFIDDIAVSKALFETVERWGKSNTVDYLHGPLGFSDLDPQGLLIEGYNELGNMATLYHYPYYKTHIEKLGFEKDCDWIEFKFNLPEKFPEILSKINKRTCQRLTLKQIVPSSMKELKPWFKDMFDLVNLTYAQHYGVVPLNENECAFYLSLFNDLIQPNYVPMLYDKNNKLIGFGFSFPSLSRDFQEFKGRLLPFNFIKLFSRIKHHNRVELGLVAIHPDYKNKGLPAVLMELGFNEFIKNGVTEIETNPELESNKAIQSFWKHVDAKCHKRRRCYIKEI